MTMVSSCKIYSERRLLCVSYLQIVVVFSPTSVVGQMLAKEQQKNFTLNDVFLTMSFSIVESFIWVKKDIQY